MKKLFASLLMSISSIIILTGCEPPYEANTAGMEKLENDLKDKFGESAYYTYVSYLQVTDNAYSVLVKVNEDKESIQMQQWVYDAGSWTDGGKETMQIGANTAGYYKFQLGKEVNLKLLGQLIEQSMNAFIGEQKGNDPILVNAVANTNNTVTDEKTKFRYTIILKDKKNAGDTHSYTYDRDGGMLISN